MAVQVIALWSRWRLAIYVSLLPATTSWALCSTILFKFKQTALQHSDQIFLLYLKKRNFIEKMIHPRQTASAGGVVHRMPTSYTEKQNAISGRRGKHEQQGPRPIAVMLSGVRIPLISRFALCLNCSLLSSDTWDPNLKNPVTLAVQGLQAKSNPA